MRDMSEDLFADEVSKLSLDEIDELFCQLEPIEPPPTLVENILAAVACLPRLAYTHPQCYAETEPPAPLEVVEGLVVRCDHLQPS
jgi:hypothetical protein